MLVLTRKLQEEIRIGDNVKITVLRINGNSVRIGIEAPNDVRIVRGELKMESDSPNEESQLEGTQAVSELEIIPENAKDTLLKRQLQQPSSSRISAAAHRTSSTLSLLAARCRSNKRQAS